MDKRDKIAVLLMIVLGVEIVVLKVISAILKAKGL